MKNKLYLQFYGSSLLVLLAILGYIVKFYPTWLHSFDQFLTTIIRIPYPQATGFFLWVTKFANPVTVIVLFLAILFVLLYGKRYAEALWYSLGILLISGAAEPLLKLVFARTRPTLEHLVVENSFSFPSGHATASILLYGTLIFFVPQFIKHKSWQWLIQLFLGSLIFIIGISRVYLGVHFPSDILAGFSLSLGWLLMTYPIYEKQRFIWRFKSKQN